MAKSKKTEIKDIIIKGKSFIIIGIDYKRREYLEKLVRTNKGRMAKSIEDNLDYLVIGETNDADENKYIKNKFIIPAKKIPSINIISLDDFENAATKSKVINKNKANSKIDSISKSELVKFLWDIVGEKIYNYKYSTNISNEEGEYLENDGLAKILKKINKNEVKVEIKAENFIDQNFKEDFSNNFNTDNLKGNVEYAVEEIEDWINNCTNKLIDLFNGFAVLGGDILYPEEGSNPWENSKTIYLEIPTFEFKLKVINKSWNKGNYYLEDEEFDSFKGHIIS